MPLFCDVALPVPVDRVFTYSIERGEPVVGGRVLVPFRREQLQGVVVALHDRGTAKESSAENISPAAIRPILRVLDQEPVLSEHLLQLGSWIAEYYLAPLGEVLRTMLPLGAEIRKEIVYSLTPRGVAVLQVPQQQTLESNFADQSEHAVLSFLAEHGQSRAVTLRNTTSASAALLQQLAAKRLITRESTAAARELRTTARVAVLVPDARLPRLNENQQRLLSRAGECRWTFARLRDSSAFTSRFDSELPWSGASWCALKKFPPSMFLKLCSFRATFRPLQCRSRRC